MEALQPPSAAGPAPRAQMAPERRAGAQARSSLIPADWLSAAQGASVSSVRTTTGVVGALSAPPEPGTLAGTMLEAASEARAMQEASDGPLGTPVAGFQHEWMRRAAQAVGDAVRDAHAREALPEIDAYERVSTLSSSMPSLILAAQRADVEDSL